MRAFEDLTLLAVPVAVPKSGEDSVVGYLGLRF